MDIPVVLHVDPALHQAKLSINIVVTLRSESTSDMAESPVEELLTIREAMSIASVGRTLLHGHIASGSLPSVRIGKRGVRIRRSALHAWIDRLPVS
jgi:excisionase family DNA binding protein